MSTGPGAVSGGVAAPARSHVLDRLATERAQAAGCFEWDRVAELDQQMTRLSQGTPASPARETAARPPRKPAGSRRG